MVYQLCDMMVMTFVRNHVVQQVRSRDRLNAADVVGLLL